MRRGLLDEGSGGVGGWDCSRGGDGGEEGEWGRVMMVGRGRVGFGPFLGSCLGLGGVDISDHGVRGRLIVWGELGSAS